MGPSVRWDDGRGDYHFDFTAKRKEVRIRTDPPGAQVAIEGEQPTERNAAMTVYNLEFPPITEEGDLKVYKGTARKDAKDAEWEPAQFSIAWDEGKQDYQVKLKEIVTQPVPLLVASGAGAELRQALGTAVFFGMLGVTAFGLVFTPTFYVVCRALGERLAQRRRRGAGDHGALAPVPAE